MRGSSRRSVEKRAGQATDLNVFVLFVGFGLGSLIIGKLLCSVPRSRSERFYPPPGYDQLARGQIQILARRATSYDALRSGSILHDLRRPLHALRYGACLDAGAHDDVLRSRSSAVGLYVAS